MGDDYHFLRRGGMEQFQYSLFIAGKSQVDNIQSGNVGGNGYDIAILYPPESFIGQFVLGI